MLIKNGSWESERDDKGGSSDVDEEIKNWKRGMKHRPKNKIQSKKVKAMKKMSYRSPNARKASDMMPSSVW
jgi:hypothetical protein